MKKYLWLFLFTIISNISFGQNNYQDVVYLKNGSVIRGVIIEQVPNKSIKIETAERNVFVFQMDEIERITKEQVSNNQTRKEEQENNSGLSSGYKGMVEFGYQLGYSQQFGMDRISLNIINGCQINPYLSLSLGKGVRYYFDLEAILIPVFGDVRIYFLDNNVSPYVSFGGGYSFDATKNFRSAGFLLNPNLGISLFVSNRSSINLSVGYELQRVETFGFNRNSGAFCINFGISF